MSDRLDHDPESDAYPSCMRREKITLAVAEEAAQWFVRVKDEPLSRADQTQYLRWLQTSPGHISEALRMGQVYGLLRDTRLRQLIASGEVSNVIELRPGLAEPPAATELRGRVGRSRRHATSRRDWRRRGKLRRRLIAVAAIIGCGVTFALVRVIVPDRTVTTEASEWRSFTLADGSIVRVGPLTELRFEFTEARRYVRLSGGEAVFQVAKDPARPFLVAAGVAVVHAVGTRFGISRTEDRVLITVAEGTVAVTQAAAPTRWFEPPATREAVRPAVPVAAGEQAAIPAEGPVTVERVDVASALAWAQGRLIFDDQNVAAAVIEFNRRNRVQIRIDDPAIAARPVRGVFDAADPESFAQFIARAAHATLVREPDVVRVQGVDLSTPGAPSPP
jgi:transmembrane sensor